jgi:ribonucleotide monophosphatase NagD (HAD superfamily)
VLYCGKPYAPIYETALERAAALRGGERPALNRVLAIGDSVRTDLSGAAALGLDCIFVTSRLHAEAYGSREAPDVAGLNAMFAAAGVAPKAIMRGLVW